MTWTSATLLALTLTATAPDAVLDSARRYLGHPYIYGGRGEYGFDCSSFVQTVFAEHGYVLPRTSRIQATVGSEVPWDALLPGDILTFAKRAGSNEVGHVAILLDDKRMIHASTGRGEVVIDPIDMRYYRLRRLSARRILDQNPGRYGPQGSHGPGVAQHDAPPAPTLASIPHPSVWHRGPVPLTRARTAVGIRSLAAVVAGRGLVAVAPRLTVRHEALDVEATLQAPVAAHLAPWQPAWRYDQPLDYLRLLDHFRAGNPEGPVYLEAGRTLSLSLGTGLVVDGATPAVSRRDLAGLPLHAPFAAATRFALGDFEAQAIVDDVVAPTLLGGAVAWNVPPRIRVTAAVDPRAPSAAGVRARWVGGVEAELALLDRDGWMLSVDAAAAMADAGQPALGTQAGSWLRLRTGAFEFAVRGALRLHDPGYLPGLFGVDYQLVRRRGPTGVPLWDELDRLALAQPWRFGWQLATHLTFTRRFGVRIGWSDDVRLADRGDHVPLRTLELAAVARDFYLPIFDVALSGYLAYHQRWVADLRAPFVRSDDRETVFAGIRVAPSAYLSIGAQIGKRPRSGSAAVEGMIDLVAELPL